MALDLHKKRSPLARVSDPMRLPGKSPTCVYAAALRYLSRFPFYLLWVLFAGKTLSAQPQQADLLGWWYKDGLPGSAQFHNIYNEVWGLAFDGREYAVIGSTAGTHFIDVTDPGQAHEVAFVPGAAQGDLIIHRDFDNYGCYLYSVCDEGNSSLQIIDFSHLPDSVSVVYDNDQQIRRAHNIYIDTLRGKLYCFSVSSQSQGFDAMRVYDLAENPRQPQFIGAYSQFGALNINHVHDGYVEDGIAYLNCGPSGLAIVDFTDPAQPITLGTLTDYPFKGYNHSGWLSRDGQYYIMGDENHGFDMKLLDVGNPSDIKVVSTIDAGNASNFSIPHNQIIACNYMYTAYYYDGLQVYDISNPALPVRVLYFPTSDRPPAPSYEGAWGVYPFLPSGNILVSDMQRGLFIVEGPGDQCATRGASVVQCAGPLDSSEPQAGSNLNIYPNPSREKVFVQTTGTKGQQKVNARLLNIQGMEIARWEMEITDVETEIPLPAGLPDGLYLLEWKNEQYQWIDRLVIH